MEQQIVTMRLFCAQKDDPKRFVETEKEMKRRKLFNRPIFFRIKLSF